MVIETESEYVNSVLDFFLSNTKDDPRAEFDSIYNLANSVLIADGSLTTSLLVENLNYPFSTTFNNFLVNLFGNEEYFYNQLIAYGVEPEWNSHHLFSAKKADIDIVSYTADLKSDLINSIMKQNSKLVEIYIPIIPKLEDIGFRNPLKEQMNKEIRKSSDRITNEGKFYLSIVIDAYKELIHKGYNFWDLWT